MLTIILENNSILVIGGGKLKRLVILVVILAVIGGVFYLNLDKTTESEDVAEKFITAYYKQYDDKEELQNILSRAANVEVLEYENSEGITSISTEKIDHYIDKNFGSLLTETFRERLIANRMIPSYKIINSHISSVEIIEIEFEIKLKDEEKATYDYKLKLIERGADGREEEREVVGEIRVVSIDSHWEVDSFIID